MQVIEILYEELASLYKVKVTTLTSAVKLEANHKPAKPPTKQPNHPQTTHKPAKYQTNNSLISQKSHRFFPKDTFYEAQHFLCPSRARREIGAFFDVPARFCISPSPLHCSLPSLIARYNPSHKLLTQLRTLTNFLRRLGLTMLQ